MNRNLVIYIQLGTFNAYWASEVSSSLNSTSRSPSLEMLGIIYNDAPVVDDSDYDLIMGTHYIIVEGGEKWLFIIE